MSHPELYGHFRGENSDGCFGQTFWFHLFLAPSGDHNRNKRSAVLIFKFTEPVESYIETFEGVTRASDTSLVYSYWGQPRK